jgi:IS30 family transposase
MAKQLTADERDRLAQYLGEGFSQKEIAQKLQRSPSTISRERTRNSPDGVYLAARAQRLAEQRRRERPIVRKLQRPELHEFVTSGLAQQWSPEQISGRLQHEHPDDPQRRVCANTIYGWIDTHSTLREHWKQQLRRRGRRPTRRRNPAAERRAYAGLAQRPPIANQRGRLGDWEGDLVLGRPGSGGLLTLTDRRSRYVLLRKVRSKHADRVHRKVRQALRDVEPACRSSITFDNGTEFTDCPKLEHTVGTQIYSADPGCPYQRGTSENTNGLLRQAFPKGIDFRTVTPHEVQRVENLMNHRPRRCLGFLTPAEVFLEKLPLKNCDSC